MGREKHQIISAGDDQIFSKTQKLCEDGASFIIRADKSFRPTERLIRMIRLTYEGVKDERWTWTAALDAWHSADILGCRSLAVEDFKYKWRYEYTPDGIDLIFDPPAAKIDQRRA